MKRRDGGEEAIPAEGRVLREAKRVRENVAINYQLAQFARETGESLASEGATAAGDRARLRGIPVTGFGGAMSGTRAERDALRNVGKLWSLVALGRDIEGTSPGTQPEEVLFKDFTE